MLPLAQTTLLPIVCQKKSVIVGLRMKRVATLRVENVTALKIVIADPSLRYTLREARTLSKSMHEIHSPYCCNV